MAAPARHPGPPPSPARRLAGAWRSLPPEERVAALAALALWVSMFLPWYGKSVTETVRGSLRAASYTLSAFGAFSFVEAAVLLVASSVLVLLFARADHRAFHLPGGDGSVILVAGVWTSLLVFYRMLDKPGTTGNAQLTTTVGLQWGIFVAIAAAIALAYAGTRLKIAHRPEPATIDDPTLTRRAPAAAPPRRRPTPPPPRHDQDETVRVFDSDEPDTADEATVQLTVDVDPVEESRRRRAAARRDRDRDRDPFGDR